MKGYLDERQYQEVNRIAGGGFLVMFFTGAVGIVLQLIFLGGRLDTVMGETLMVMAGGIFYLAGCIRKGIFSSKQKPMTFFQNLLFSVVCSGMFSIFYGIILAAKFKAEIAAGRYVGLFFAGITILCFVVLMAMSRCAVYIRNKNEQKYDD